jgi:sorting nexin-7/30
LLYIEAVKEALNRRDSVQIEYELTVEELKKKRVEKDVVSLYEVCLMNKI